MPTVVVELSVLDESRWADAIRAAGDAMRVYRDGPGACIVMAIDTIGGAETALSLLPGMVAVAAVEAMTIKIMEPVAIVTVDGEGIQVDRLWPRGRGQG